MKELVEQIEWDWQHSTASDRVILVIAIPILFVAFVVSKILEIKS